MKRYQKQMLLKGFNSEIQEKLFQSKALVIGAGGLGCPLMISLASAGVGTIGVVDFDKVDLTNLHRQILYSEADVGKLKVEVAVQKLQLQFPDVCFKAIGIPINNSNAVSIIDGYDIVIDCTDNFATRYLVNDTCVLLNKTLVYGSIYQYEGQVAVFNYPVLNERSCNYRDLFPEPPNAYEVPNCEESGVLGVLTGIIGNFQANETIKILTGIGRPLYNKLFVFNSLNCSSYELQLTKSAKSAVQIPKTIEELKKKQYDFSCQAVEIKEISAEQFWDIADKQKGNVLVIDVRNKNEKPELTGLNSIQIPLHELENMYAIIPDFGQLILVCQSGKRSLAAAQILKKKLTNKSIMNLKGGILSLKTLANN